MTPATQSLPITVSRQVLDFAAEHGAGEYLPGVLEMTGRVFPGGLRDVIIDDDPEIANNRHIVMVVKMKGLDVAEALESRWQWNGGLFQCCPAPLVCVFRLDLSIAS